MTGKKRPILDEFKLTELNQDDSEDLIELVAMDDEQEQEQDAPADVPILPIKNTVLFPGVVIPVTVGRQKSIKLVKKAYSGDRLIGVLAQKNNNEEPQVADLYKIGTLARILKMLVLPDGNTTIIIQGKQRYKVEEFITEDPNITARVKYLKDRNTLKKSNKESSAMVQTLKEAASKILTLNPEIPQEAQVALDNISNPTFLTHFLSSNLNVDVMDKQRLLDVNDGKKRADMLLSFMLQEVEVLELKHEIHKKVSSDIDHQQRDYYLRQQM